MPANRIMTRFFVFVALMCIHEVSGAFESLQPDSPRPFGVFVETIPYQPIDPDSDDELPGFRINTEVGIFSSFPSRNAVELVTEDATHQLSEQLRVDGIGLHRPTGLCWDGTSLWIADTGHRRILRAELSEDGTNVVEVQAIRHEQFRRPIGIAYAEDRSEIFVSDAWSDRVFVLDESHTVSRVIAQHGSQRGFLSGPMGIDYRDGLVYVADSRNSRVQVFDASDASFHSEWGLHVIRPHEADGRLHYPASVRITDDGSRAIVDEPWEHRSQIFERPSDSQTVPVRLPLGADDFVHYGPGIDSYDRLLAITDPDTHTIRIFDLSLETPVLIAVLGGYGSAPHELIHPSSVAFIAPTESQPLRLAAADRGNARLALFTLDWSPDEPLRFRPKLASLTRTVDLHRLHETAPPKPKTVPIDPVSILATPDGSLVILDDANSAIVEFDDRLRATRTTKLPGSHGLWKSIRAHPDGSLLAVDSAASRLLRVVLSTEPAIDQFRSIDLSQWCDAPTDIAVMENGYLVSDSDSHRIMYLDDDYEPIRVIGREGLGTGEFFSPTSIVRIKDDRIAVVDRGNHRLKIFNSQWELETVAGPRLYINDVIIGDRPAIEPIRSPDSE